MLFNYPYVQTNRHTSATLLFHTRDYRTCTIQTNILAQSPSPSRAADQFFLSEVRNPNTSAGDHRSDWTKRTHRAPVRAEVGHFSPLPDAMLLLVGAVYHLSLVLSSTYVFDSSNQPSTRGTRTNENRAFHRGSSMVDGITKKNKERSTRQRAAASRDCREKLSVEATFARLPRAGGRGERRGDAE